MKRLSRVSILKTAVLLFLTVSSLIWAGSFCSAGTTGTIEILGSIPPMMELRIKNSVIQWDELGLGENDCPTSSAYSVISNVPFRVTIMSENPRMQVTGEGLMQGATLKNPLEWSADLSDKFVPISELPAVVISGDYHSDRILHSIEFRQKIDVTDQPIIEPQQYYRSTIILSLEPAA